MSRLSEVFGTVALTTLTTIMMYYLMVGIAVDAIDGFVEADILANDHGHSMIPDISIVNYIIMIEMMVFAGTFMVIAAYLTRNVGLCLSSVLAGFVVMMGIALVGLLSIPGFRLEPNKFFIIIPLFAAFVLDPASVQLIFGLATIGCFVLLSVFEKGGIEK